MSVAAIEHGALAEEAFEALLPRVFTIETALACNLRCPECAIGGGMITRRQNLLPFERFVELAEKIRPHAEYVNLHLWGEPTLNPRIVEMIRHVASFARTNISTHGLLLDREKAEALVTSGLSDLIVSIDGMTQEVYEQYRVGGRLERALQALEWLAESNRAHGEPVRLMPQFIVFRHNQHEMDDFRRHCDTLGLRPFFKAPYIRNGDGRFAPSDHPRLVRPEFSDLAALRGAMRDCTNPREVFTVLSDGSVVVCCHDFDRATCFGNLFEQEVTEIWQDPRYRAFRRSILEGRAPRFCLEHCMTWLPAPGLLPPRRINLCGGSIRIPGYAGVDLAQNADIVLDLEQELLPLADDSVDALVCISAINYFTLERAREIVADVHRVLAPGGVARFGTQDLEHLAGYYLGRDGEFWDERLADDRARFPGRTHAEKLNAFFNGFPTTGGKRCRFVYDYETLALLFADAGFSLVERREYGSSRLPEVAAIDNRPEQMFFLEAVK